MTSIVLGIKGHRGHLCKNSFCSIAGEPLDPESSNFITINLIEYINSFVFRVKGQGHRGNLCKIGLLNNLSTI